MEGEYNPEYRLDHFKMEIESSIRLMGQTPYAINHGFDTKNVIDHLAYQIVLPMLLRTVFRIRLPKDFGLQTKQKNIYDFQAAIDKYFDYQSATENRYHSSHRSILTNYLQTIGKKSSFADFKTRLMSYSEALTPGSCDYHDDLIRVVKLCLDHISDLYEANNMVIREEDNNEDNNEANNENAPLDDTDTVQIVTRSDTVETL